ncbi:MAG: VOC family protein [Thermodesulfobacteriota bacterium]
MAIIQSTHLGAVGIGVNDLDRSTDFYIRVFGMKKVWKLKLPHMQEMILNFEGGRGASLVLMHYVDGSNPHYSNNPVKLVFYVPDPRACMEMIRQEGLEILREALAVPELQNAVVGLAKDPDGYLLEILQAAGSGRPL